MLSINYENLKLSADSGLRPYQKTNKERIYDCWKQKKSVMLQMPTGTGKTRLFSSIIKDIEAYSRRNGDDITCLVMVHRMELISQIVNTLKNLYGLDSGIIQAGFRQNDDSPLQVASVQTLSRRLEKWVEKKFDFIIVDEAHHVPAESYKKILNAFPDAKVLGVTATPYRLSGEGFTDIFDDLIISPTVRQFIDMGVLSKYDYYSVRLDSEVQRELKKIKNFPSGDYSEQDLSRICDNSRIRAQIVETYLKYAFGKKGIVYTINKEHNFNLCEDFKQNNIRAVAIDSNTPAEIRMSYVDDFKNGKIDVICNVNIFSEGFDCPDIEFVQLARPTQSLSMFLQQVGRGLRISNGKEKCLFLDNVGLYYLFGFPSSRRDWLQYFKGQNPNEQVLPNGLRNRLARERNVNLTEGNEEVHLIETLSELKYEKKLALEIFEKLHAYNSVLVKRDDSSLNILEEEFSKKKECVLCFDGKKVSVWKKRSDDNGAIWDVDFYLKNFRFRFDHEPETRFLTSEDELNKWLTFRYLAIREKVDEKNVAECRKALLQYSLDRDYLIDIYNRWFDNESECPMERNMLLEQLVAQTYEFVIENESGNRVFDMIMNLPAEKRRKSLGRMG